MTHLMFVGGPLADERGIDTAALGGMPCLYPVDGGTSEVRAAAIELAQGSGWLTGTWNAHVLSTQAILVRCRVPRFERVVAFTNAGWRIRGNAPRITSDDDLIQMSTNQAFISIETERELPPYPFFLCEDEAWTTATVEVVARLDVMTLDQLPDFQLSVWLRRLAELDSDRRVRIKRSNPRLSWLGRIFRSATEKRGIIRPSVGLTILNELEARARNTGLEVGIRLPFQVGCKTPVTFGVLTVGPEMSERCWRCTLHLAGSRPSVSIGDQLYRCASRVDPVTGIAREEVANLGTILSCSKLE
jgi:hypothetical protein